MKKLKALIRLLFSREWLVITGEGANNFLALHESLKTRCYGSHELKVVKPERKTKGDDFGMLSAKQIIAEYSTEYWLESAEKYCITIDKAEYLTYQRDYIELLFEEAIKHGWGFPRQTWQIVMANIDKAIEKVK